ncbi:MAG: helix-turn-helix domain-containing protein [Planctomycetes bacterium]|nr:helix-turn-helix domain-containing protein [Planctomycetota bacterium]
MSNHWLNVIFTHSPAKAGHRLVLLSYADRANGQGICWPSVADTARRTNLAERTVRQINADLIRAGELEITETGGGAGKTNIYRLVNRGAHDPKTLRQATGFGGPKTLRQTTKTLRQTTENPEPGLRGTIRNPQEPPKKRSSDVADDVVEGIYQAYPRHVGKRTAIRAIRAALVRIAAQPGIGAHGQAGAWLLERVQAFANSPAGQAGKFTPHPATFFNSERYDDDSAEWDRSEKSADHSRKRGRQFAENLRL